MIGRLYLKPTIENGQWVERPFVEWHDKDGWHDRPATIDERRCYQPGDTIIINRGKPAWTLHR